VAALVISQMAYLIGIRLGAVAEVWILGNLTAENFHAELVASYWGLPLGTWAWREPPSVISNNRKDLSIEYCPPMQRRLVLVLVSVMVCAAFFVALPTAEAVPPSDTGQWVNVLDEQDGRWNVIATTEDGSTAIAGQDFPSISPVSITRDSGWSWSTLSALPDALWNDLALSSNGTVMAMSGTVSGQSRVWISRDGGDTFS